MCDLRALAAHTTPCEFYLPLLAVIITVRLILTPITPFIVRQTVICWRLFNFYLFLVITSCCRPGIHACFCSGFQLWRRLQLNSLKALSLMLLTD